MAERTRATSALRDFINCEAAGGIILMVVQLVLHIAGIRGANALGKFRNAQAY